MVSYGRLPVYDAQAPRVACRRSVRGPVRRLRNGPELGL